MDDLNKKEGQMLRWRDKAERFLVGKTIKKVRFLTLDEVKELGWYESTIVLIFDDGSYLFAAMDEEGNGPGVLFTSDERLPVIPRI
jgi:hypothetical protein